MCFDCIFTFIELKRIPRNIKLTNSIFLSEQFGRAALTIVHSYNEYNSYEAFVLNGAMKLDFVSYKVPNWNAVAGTSRKNSRISIMLLGFLFIARIRRCCQSFVQHALFCHIFMRFSV